MEEQQAPSTLAIAAKYGLIQGVLAFVILIVQARTGMRQGLLAIVSIAILVVLMILAHREFTRTHNRMMRYAQGLGSGTLLAAVGALVSCILTFIYVKYINTGYLAAQIQTQHAALAERGITGAQAQQAMRLYSAIYSPVTLTVISLVGGVIFGFIVALIVSIFTQRGDPRVVR